MNNNHAFLLPFLIFAVVVGLAAGVMVTRAVSSLGTNLNVDGTATVVSSLQTGGAAIIATTGAGTGLDVRNGNVNLGPGNTTVGAGGLTVNGNISFGSATLSYKSGSSPSCTKMYVTRNWSARTCSGNNVCTTSSGWSDAGFSCQYYVPPCPNTCTIANCYTNQWTEAVCID